MSSCRLLNPQFIAKVLVVLILFVSLFYLTSLEDVKRFGKMNAVSLHKFGSELLDAEMSAFIEDNEDRKQTVKTMCNELADQGYYFENSRHDNRLQFWLLKNPKFLFCRTPKTGTSTWADVVLNYYNKSHEEHGQTTIISIQHELISAEEKMTEVSKMKYGPSDTKRALVVRHPLERLQSAYNDKIKHKVMRVFYPNGTAIPEATYEEFLYWIANLPLPMEEHFCPNSYLCNPCMYHYDYIIKMETFERDSNAVIRKVNLLKNFTIQHHHNLESAKNMSKSSAPTDEDLFKLLEGLDADTLSKLYQKFLPDFRLFGYDPTPLEEMITRKVQESSLV